jgi:uncharacterized membrane protein YkoI
MSFGITLLHTRKALYAAAAALMLVIGAAGVACADDDDDDDISEQEAVRAALQRGEVLPLSRIVAITLAEVPGDVIKVKLEHDDGRIVYEIKVLTPRGRVREVELDARTGTILKIEND